MVTSSRSERRQRVRRHPPHPSPRPDRGAYSWAGNPVHTQRINFPGRKSGRFLALCVRRCAQDTGTDHAHIKRTHCTDMQRRHYDANSQALANLGRMTAVPKLGTQKKTPQRFRGTVAVCGCVLIALGSCQTVAELFVFFFLRFCVLASDSESCWASRAESALIRSSQTLSQTAPPSL